VKTWLPATYNGPKSWLDQLVYDRALLLVGVRYSSFNNADFILESYSREEGVAGPDDLS